MLKIYLCHRGFSIDFRPSKVFILKFLFLLVENFRILLQNKKIECVLKYRHSKERTIVKIVEKWEKSREKKSVLKSARMQGYRNYNFEQQQRNQPIVVDILPSQYTKPSTPPPSPTYKGKQSWTLEYWKLDYRRDIWVILFTDFGPSDWHVHQVTIRWRRILNFNAFSRSEFSLNTARRN